MIIKILAFIGLLSLIFIFNVILAAIFAAIDGRHIGDPEDDEEQAEFLKEWRRQHERRK